MHEIIVCITRGSRVPESRFPNRTPSQTRPTPPGDAPKKTTPTRTLPKTRAPRGEKWHGVPAADSARLAPFLAKTPDLSLRTPLGTIRANRLWSDPSATSDWSDWSDWSGFGTWPIGISLVICRLDIEPFPPNSHEKPLIYRFVPRREPHAPSRLPDLLFCYSVLPPTRPTLGIGNLGFPWTLSAWTLVLSHPLPTKNAQFIASYPLTNNQ